MSTAAEHIRTVTNGSLMSQVFLAVGTSVVLYLTFVHDWSPLRQVRIQSPITFVSDQQPGISLAAVAGGRQRIDTIRIATAAPAQFDLRAVAQVEHIELDPEDLTLDQARQAYIRRFSATAVAEMKAFGVPASITIAQGLLETRAGQSALATKANNHFGIKCFSRNCKKGHCTNFTDDTHKDFFIKYPSAWASFRAHSKLLRSGRYAGIHGDYRDWAIGLKRAGYATAPNYSESLIRLIRLYGLDRLDKM